MQRVRAKGFRIPTTCHKVFESDYGYGNYIRVHEYQRSVRFGGETLKYVVYPHGVFTTDYMYFTWTLDEAVDQAHFLMDQTLKSRRIPRKY